MANQVQPIRPRLKPKPKPLPKPRRVRVNEFVDFLISIDEKVCRPPVQAAKLLTFIVQLYKARGGPRPFPTRPQVAEHLGMSVATIDAVLNLHIAEGTLAVEIRYRDGNIEQRRASVIKERYIIPSDVLIGVYEYHWVSRYEPRSP